MMELVEGISTMQQAQTATNIQYATAAKVMKATQQIQEDFINQMLGSMGIGNNLNISG